MSSTSSGWRSEADDAWLADHSSDNLDRLRGSFNLLVVVAEALSHADVGPLGGAPRNPRLKVGDKPYSVVRFAKERVAYTVIRVERDRCRRCGERLLEKHRMIEVCIDATHIPVAVVRACRRCQATSWLFQSRSPDPKTVL